MKRNYIKPEIIIILTDTTNLMFSSCSCHGHCSCNTNHNHHCGCDNRPIKKNYSEEFDF